MTGLGEIVATILWLYFVVLLARFVIDLVQMLSRTWQPKGFVLLLCEAVFTLTDPPLKRCVRSSRRSRSVGSR